MVNNYGTPPSGGGPMSGGGCVCPNCGFGFAPGMIGFGGYGGQFSQGGMPGGYGGFGGYGFGPGSSAPWGLGGLRTWGGTYSSQYTSTGLPTDEEITEMVFDAIDADPLIPYDADIDVVVDSGEVTLAGTVPNKRIKHAAGEDTWWIPGVTDVHNQLQVGGRRRSRSAPKEQTQS
jgi:hypothetical protein